MMRSDTVRLLTSSALFIAWIPKHGGHQKQPWQQAKVLKSFLDSTLSDFTRFRRHWLSFLSARGAMSSDKNLDVF